MHRLLFWVLFLISLGATILTIVSILNMNMKVAIISFIVASISAFISKLVRIDHNLKR